MGRLHQVVEEIRAVLVADPDLLGEATEKKPMSKKAFAAAAKKAKGYGVTLKKHYVKECSMKAYNHNVQWFYRVHLRSAEGPKKAKVDQAVAASYSTLRRACGIPSSAPKMTPKEIIGAAG
jgi:hypothetical protein